MGKKARAREKEHEAAVALAVAEALAAARGAEAAPEPDIDHAQLATRLNSVAIHLLRRLQREDAELGVSAARLSALSVLVLGGARTLGSLAAAEDVRPPSMTRLVNAMEQDGLVQRIKSPSDGRLVIISATAEGERLLNEGRERRVVALAGWLRDLGPAALRTIDGAAGHLETIISEHRDR